MSRARCIFKTSFLATALFLIAPASEAWAQVANPSAMGVDQLRLEASKAYAADRLWGPAGNNAMEYYLALRDKQPADAATSSALTDLLPLVVIAAEQTIERRHVDEARRLVTLIQRADASHPALSRLKEGISALDAFWAAAVSAAADAAAEAPRDRWLELGSTDASTLYVDTQTIQRNGNDVTAWVKDVYDKPVSAKADTYDETLILRTYHCASRQYTTKVLSRRFRGNPVWSAERKNYEQERISIMPGTIGEGVLEAVCNGQ